MPQAPRIEIGEVARRCRLANEVWTSLWTAITGACLRTHGSTSIAELEHRSLRRHHRKHFLPGLEKLGLRHEATDAIRCGKYHYFSNSLGGLPMEYVEESPHKVWVRYRPPFWIGDGVTQPSAGPAFLSAQFGRAAFRGWHAHNGAMLGNPRLAFVQTQNLTDGDPWDAGYFLETDRDLEPEETYQRRPGEWGPRFDAAQAPRLPHADWPDERRARALRNYAVDHVATRCTVLCEMHGVPAGAAVVEHGVRMLLAQRWIAYPRMFGIDSIRTPRAAAEYFAGMAGLLDDDLEICGGDGAADEVVVRQSTARLWRDEPVALVEIDQAIASAWSAVLPLYAWGLRMRLERAISAGDDCTEWVFDAGGTPAAPGGGSPGLEGDWR